MVKQFENDQHTLYHWGVALWNKRKKQYCNNNSDSNRLFCFCCAVSCVLVPTQSLKVYNKRPQETSTSQVAYDTALRILFLILAFFLLLPVHSDRKKKKSYKVQTLKVIECVLQKVHTSFCGHVFCSAARGVTIKIQNRKQMIIQSNIPTWIMNFCLLMFTRDRMYTVCVCSNVCTSTKLS